MRSHEVTREQELLNSEGEIAEPGWARSLVWKYSRGQIKAPKFRIKEWDYYLIMSDKFGLALTISDDGYIGLQSASLLLFGEESWEHTETILNVFPMGKLHMPESSSQGNVKYQDKRLHMEYRLEKNKRILKCNFKNFLDGKTLRANITLQQPDMDTMVIATPWDQKHAFYYNQKINCMRASGKVEFDGKTYTFDPKTDFGTLDWGRGVWTYDDTWYWGSGNADINGHAFGFNIGYGFGNTEAATENVIFYDGKVHKLENVRFNIPGDTGPNPFISGGKQVNPKDFGPMDAPSYKAPWTFTSSDGRFEMKFVPVLDRAAKIDVKAICSDQHQVFGRMTGKAILDDGTVIEVKDLLCFAEKVHNRY